MSVINILGVFCLLIFPPLFEYIVDLHPQEMATFIGGSLAAVGHVVAVGYMIDKETGDLALAIKMIRVMLIIPVVILLLTTNSKGQKKSWRTFGQIF